MIELKITDPAGLIDSDFLICEDSTHVILMGETTSAGKRAEIFEAGNKFFFNQDKTRGEAISQIEVQNVPFESSISVVEGASRYTFFIVLMDEKILPGKELYTKIK